ncbi:MAG TPA: SRPBCC family protein [Anaerolineales bacterium]|nr:SRPBCC family protein [Anaerolineales bacterium]
MTTVVRTHEILVRASLQDSFDYISDVARHPEWSSGRLVIEAMTPGPIAVGKEYISHGEVAIQKKRPNTIRVSEYEPPHRFGFVANDPDFGEVAHIFTLTEQRGGTLIRRMMTLTLNPIVAIAFRFFIYPLIGRPSMDKSLALLKSKLEEKSPT